MSSFAPGGLVVRTSADWGPSSDFIPEKFTSLPAPFSNVIANKGTVHLGRVADWTQETTNVNYYQQQQQKEVVCNCKLILPVRNKQYNKNSDQISKISQLSLAQNTSNTTFKTREEHTIHNKLQRDNSKEELHAQQLVVVEEVPLEQLVTNNKHGILMMHAKLVQTQHKTKPVVPCTNQAFKYVFLFFY
jgi:hypothetical protein